MSTNLPTSPSLRQLKTQAKELLQKIRAGDAQALDLVAQFRLSSAPHKQAHSIGLQEAQAVLARSYSFSTWERLVAAASSPDPRNALARAIDEGDLSYVRQTISANPALLHRDSVTYRNGTMKALPYAAGAQQVEISRFLIESGADPRANNDFPMVKALGGPCADLLLEYGIDLNAQIGSFGPLILFATEDHRVDGLRWLLENGADPDRICPGASYQRSALEMAVLTYGRSEGRHECVDLLVGAGASYTDGPEMDIHRGRLDLLEQRLKKRPALVHQPSDLWQNEEKYGGYFGGAPLRAHTLLHMCAEYNEVEAAELLLKYGADVNARAAHPDNNHTPVYHAVTSNFNSAFPILEWLIKNGADLSMRSTLRVPDCDVVLTDVTPLGYVLRYANNYHPGPGSGLKKKLDTSPHDNVVELLRRHGAPE